MTSPMAAWRVTYTPGEWLVLSGPTMLVVMLPAPPRMSDLVNTLWDDILGTGSVGALLKLFGEYGLDQMSDFAAFFWDEAGLHGMARGQLAVMDADTGDTVVSGSDVVTWREEPLGTTRHLRVGMQQVREGEHLQLPLVVGAVMASAIQLSTDAESRVQFADGGEKGIMASAPVPVEPTAVAVGAGIAQDLNPVEEDVADEAPDQDALDEDESPTEVVGLGDETEMEPFFESSATPDEPADESELVSAPAPRNDFDEDIPLWSPPDEYADTEGEDESDGLGGLRFDADEDHNDGEASAVGVAPVPGPDFTTPIPPPAVATATVLHNPSAEAEAQRQIMAVPCARGHANPPGSRNCRICLAPVDSANPQLINRPAMAGVHSNQGEFANVAMAVVVGRSPAASKGPRGAHLMRVESPSSDISRSHLIVASRDWSVIVTDLDSTNGTTVIPVGEQSFVLANGESVQVELGTVLDLGDGVSLRIEPPRG